MGKRLFVVVSSYNAQKINLLTSGFLESPKLQNFPAEKGETRMVNLLCLAKIWNWKKSHYFAGPTTEAGGEGTKPTVVCGTSHDKLFLSGCFVRLLLWVPYYKSHNSYSIL